MLKKILIGVLLNAIALYGVTYLLPSITYSGGIAFFVLGGLIMGFLNAVIKPILKLIAFPIQILTIGISLILLNGVIFWIFDVLMDALQIGQITMNVPAIKTYFLAGFAFGIINWLEHLFVKK